MCNVFRLLLSLTEQQCPVLLKERTVGPKEDYEFLWRALTNDLFDVLHCLIPLCTLQGGPSDFYYLGSFVNRY